MTWWRRWTRCPLTMASYRSTASNKRYSWISSRRKSDYWRWSWRGPEITAKRRPTQGPPHRLVGRNIRNFSQGCDFSMDLKVKIIFEISPDPTDFISTFFYLCQLDLHLVGYQLYTRGKSTKISLKFTCIAMLLFFSKDVIILHELLIYVHWFI